MSALAALLFDRNDEAGGYAIERSRCDSEGAWIEAEAASVQRAPNAMLFALSAIGDRIEMVVRL